MSSTTSHPEADLATLRWLMELGADEAIGDSAIDRYALPAKLASRAVPAGSERSSAGVGQPTPVAAAVAAAAPPLHAVQPDHLGMAAELAAQCTTLEALRQAVEAFEGCALKRGARNTVFCDGNPAADLMIIGEAPGRDEDSSGRPFVGASGQLLDKMLAAIGISRTSTAAKSACYITNVLPWRPPQNRDPSADEAAMMLPFLRRHITLAEPKVIVLLGNVPARALLGATMGITKLRGQWAEVEGRPALHMLHPAGLLRNPINKRMAWADLQALRARLDEV